MNNCAWEQAHQILRLAAPLFGAEEMQDVVTEAYAIALTGIECYAVPDTQDKPEWSLCALEVSAFSVVAVSSIPRTRTTSALAPMPLDCGRSAFN
jgi:hypothetical protein